MKGNKKGTNRTVMYAAFVLLLLPGSIIPVAAQNFEAGLGVGAYNYSGDLSGYRFEHHRPAGQLIFRINPNEYISFRTTFTAGQIMGSETRQGALSQQRNAADFTIFAANLSSGIEYHFLNYKDDIRRLRWTPYLFVGIGAAYFGSHDAPSANTSPVQFNFPGGMGFKYILNPRWILGIEWTAHKTYYDIIDNVSGGDLSRKNFQYGNRFDKDWFYFLGLTINYTFYTIPCPVEVN